MPAFDRPYPFRSAARRPSEYREATKGTVLLVVAVLAAIGIGVALENTPQSSPPNVALAAIDKTMAVSSLELEMTPAPPQNRSRSPLETYNAPDRLQGSAVLVDAGASNLPTTFIGGTEYVAHPAPARATGGSTSYLDLPFSGLRPDGLNGEQLRAFPDMEALREGVGFQKTTSGYTFGLFTEETTHPTGRGLGPANSIVTELLGGQVVLADGYVRRLTIDAVTNGRAFNPLNVTPTIALSLLLLTVAYRLKETAGQAFSHLS